VKLLVAASGDTKISDDTAVCMPERLRGVSRQGAMKVTNPRSIS